MEHESEENHQAVGNKIPRCVPKFSGDLAPCASVPLGSHNAWPEASRRTPASACRGSPWWGPWRAWPLGADGKPAAWRDLGQGLPFWASLLKKQKWQKDVDFECWSSHLTFKHILFKTCKEIRNHILFHTSQKRLCVSNICLLTQTCPPKLPPTPILLHRLLG